MKIRTRFAPSPTGFLHIGGLRTALYNFLFARQNKGKFILRIEDTDQARLIEGATKNLIKTLSMCGLEYDEGPNKNGKFGPYTQSKRLNIYQQYLLRLIKEEKAYPCFFKNNNKNELVAEFNVQDAIDRMQSELYVVKFKIKSNQLFKTYDEIRGEVTFDLNLIEDPIIYKSDGYPTYHFANVIDDYLMKISHVIRGEEWLPSLPKHILLYKAFNWEPPKFFHLPLLLNLDKSKLSKRQGDVAVEEFLNKGYMKDCLINFVALLGWHPSHNQEIFSLNELMDSFEINRINKSGAVFDIEKLNWMNKTYLQNIDISDLNIAINKICKENRIELNNKNKLSKMIAYGKPRAYTINGIFNEIKCFINYKKTNHELLKKYSYKMLIKFWVKNLEQLEVINQLEINNLIALTKDELNIMGKNIFIPLRLMLIGQEYGPDLFTMLNILGKKESIRRLKLNNT